MQVSQAATGRKTGPGAVIAGDIRGKLNVNHPGLRHVQNTELRELLFMRLVQAHTNVLTRIHSQHPEWVADTLESLSITSLPLLVPSPLWLHAFLNL